MITRSLTVILFVLFVSALPGQELKEKQLLGSWRLESTEMNGTVYPPSELDMILSFYRRHHYQQRDSLICPANISFTCPDTTYQAGGSWIFSRKDSMLYFEDHHNIPDNGTIYFQSERTVKISRLTDSSLVFIEADVAYHYRKIPVMPRLEDVSVTLPEVVEVPEISEGAGTADTMLFPLRPQFYLVNSADTSRRVSLNDGEEIEVSADSVFADTTQLFHSFLTGDVVRMTDSTVTFEVTVYNTDHRDYGTSVRSVSSSYYGFYPYQTLSQSTLKWMKYSPSYRRNRNYFFGFITTLSAIDVLIVAPLASINYKTGTFNSQRYYKWAGIGLAGISVGIPVLLFTKPRKYLLTTPGGRQDKNYWYLEKR